MKKHRQWRTREEIDNAQEKYQKYLKTLTKEEREKLEIRIKGILSS